MKIFCFLFFMTVKCSKYYIMKKWINENKNIQSMPSTNAPIAIVGEEDQYENENEHNPDFSDNKGYLLRYNADQRCCYRVFFQSDESEDEKIKQKVSLKIEKTKKSSSNKRKSNK